VSAYRQEFLAVTSLCAAGPRFRPPGAGWAVFARLGARVSDAWSPVPRCAVRPPARPAPQPPPPSTPTSSSATCSSTTLSPAYPSLPAAQLRASVRRHRRAHDVPCDDGKELESSIYYRNGRRCSRRWQLIKPAVSLLAAPSSVANLACFGGHQSNGRFLYCVGRLATSSQKNHCDGFRYSSGEGVKDEGRRCTCTDDGAKSRLGA